MGMREQVAVIAAMMAMGGAAEAQTAPSCSLDPAGGTLIVSMNGGTLRLTASASGAILLNGGDCAGATTTNTNGITVRGNETVPEKVVLSGAFAPGMSPETDDPEIEISLQLGPFTSFNEVVVNLTGRDDVATASVTGLNVNGDGDDDVLWQYVQDRTVNGRGGNDTLDGGTHIGGAILRLYGGNGDDLIIGSGYRDFLYGDAGNDTIDGRGENDTIDGGPGSDTLDGEGGNDKFLQGTAPDADTIVGGPGRDQVSYGSRTAAVTVTLGNGLADDGEPGEGDFVASDVEDATGGAGDDLLIGDAGPNILRGHDGSDHLVGGDGADRLYGGLGNDLLDGGGAGDQFFGEAGDDVFLNADGIAETVDCGVGVDDPEADAPDTFIGCEL